MTIEEAAAFTLIQTLGYCSRISLSVHLFYRWFHWNFVQFLWEKIEQHSKEIRDEVKMAAKNNITTSSRCPLETRDLGNLANGESLRCHVGQHTCCSILLVTITSYTTIPLYQYSSGHKSFISTVIWTSSLSERCEQHARATCLWMRQAKKLAHHQHHHQHCYHHNWHLRHPQKVSQYWYLWLATMNIGILTGRWREHATTLKNQDINTSCKQ